MWVICVMVVVASVCALAEPSGVTQTSAAADAVANISVRYAFYRSMEGEGRSGADGGSGTRRIFGGAAAELERFPWAAALLDRYWAARCSGAAVAPHWVLTAAHCVTPRLAYVKYNTRRPASPEGDFTPVQYLYRHPKFEVVQTTGEDADVTLLHHDVGLVRTRDAMRLRAAPPADLRAALLRYNPQDLTGEEVEVLGFGRTERSVLGEELFSARLRLRRCGRGDWLHCVCGAAAAADAAPRGVCSGDSGGPVLYRNVQVGVTSMGPVECARAGGPPAAGASSVFTSLYQYAALVNATIADADAALRMHRVGRAATRPSSRLALLLPTALLLPAR